MNFYYNSPSYKAARGQLEKNLEAPKSPINQGIHVLMFLQGLCTANWMEHNDIQVAYAQNFCHPAYVAHYAKLAAKKRIVTVVNGHNTDTVILTDDEVRYRFDHIDAVVADSECAREAYRRSGVDISHVPVIYRGIDVDFFSQSARMAGGYDGSDRDKTVEITCVARAEEKKGFNYAIEALSKIPEDLHVHVTHIGEGPLLNTWKKQAWELGVGDKITFMGHLSNAKAIRDKLLESDLFIMPNVNVPHADGVTQEAADALPRAVLEAAACGLPIITTDAGGSKEAVHNGVNGILVPERSAQELADAIYELATDPKKRETFATRSRRIVVEKFNYLTSQLPLVDLLERLIILINEREGGFTEPLSASNVSAPWKARAGLGYSCNAIGEESKSRMR